MYGLPAIGKIRYHGKEVCCAIAQEYNISTPEASAEICRCAKKCFAHNVLQEISIMIF